jgi:transcriptional regulator with XRE-family HTH domain
MNESFCQRLSRLREAKRWSHQELAQKSDMKVKKVVKLESDVGYVPTWGEICKLSKALKTEPLYLATGDVYCFPTKRASYYPAGDSPHAASQNA